ncbi:MAG TPA: DAK2 domain-containing protein [Bacilli bacterium]|nr:DAK2 domain-containing protein [Bacilli bacterium]
MKEINGTTLKQMIISGANNLYNNYPAIDALNVFPVPDGDTGMNMNLTISSGAKEIANRNDVDVFEIAKAFSKGLLMGARGNSGVITSQIFRGFAKSLEGKKTIRPVDFAEAWISGKEVAYKAVMRPVEGTILTVVRESAQALADVVNNDWSIEKCMKFLIEEAKASLERTPDLLPILKEVGVVDSGGAGLVTILEGMQSGLLGNIIQKSQATAVEEAPKQAPAMAGAKVEGDEFGYCTEFIMRLGPEDSKRPFVEKRFSNVLNSHGNSIVIVRDDDIVKVHIHTLSPGNVLSYAQQFGEFVTLKVENMSEQHNHLEQGAEKLSGKAHPKVKQDDSLNLHKTHSKVEKKEELKEYALIAVAAGDGLEELFKQYRVDYVVKGGQTMNPSTEDFMEAIRNVKAKNIYILPNNSNIIMAAAQACDVLEENSGSIAKVIPSKTIPQGLVAAMNFNPDVSPEENFHEMSAALTTVKTGLVTYATKDTTIDGLSVRKNDFMGIQDKKIVLCGRNLIDATYNLVKGMIDDLSSIVTIIVGEDVKDKDKEQLISRLESENPDVEFAVETGGQPVYYFIVGVE